MMSDGWSAVVNRKNLAKLVSKHCRTNFDCACDGQLDGTKRARVPEATRFHVDTGVSARECPTLGGITIVQYVVLVSGRVDAFPAARL